MSDTLLPRKSVEDKLKHLFVSAATGDRQAYEGFLELSMVVVEKYLAFLGHRYLSHQALEDLKQDVLVSLHEKKHTFQVQRPILPWIYAITRYRFIDFYRQQKRVPLMVAWDEGHIVAVEKSLSPDWEDLVSLLSPKQKEMFQMIKIEGESYVDTARALDVSVASVKVGIHRIMKALKEKVKK